MDTTIRNGSGRKRENRRKIQRRMVFFELHAETLESHIRKIERRIMSQSEAMVLFKAINSHQLSRFGILKLANVDLDQEYDLNDDKNTKTTLLAHSVLKNAHSITSQLIRAGANPTLCLSYPDEPHPSNKLSSSVCHQLMILSSCHRVLVTTMFVKFRLRYQFENSKRLCDCGCGKNAGLITQPCNHYINTECYWHRVLTCMNRGAHCDVTCCLPCCRVLWDLPSEAGSLTSVPLTTLEILRHEALMDMLASNEPNDSEVTTYIAMRSRRLWAALPITARGNYSSIDNGYTIDGTFRQKYKKSQSMHYTLPDTNGTRNLAFRLNMATPLVSACFDLHDTQTLRSQELYRATCLGYTQRVLELIRVGCDIDDQDDCGVCILSTAIYHGHEEVVRVLLACGARIDIADRLGILPLDIARTVNSAVILQMLLDRGASSRDGTSQAHDSWYEPDVGWSKAGSVWALEEHISADTANYNSDWHGASAFVIDNAFTEPYLQHLEEIFNTSLQQHIQLGCKGNSANDDTPFQCINDGRPSDRDTCDPEGVDAATDKSTAACVSPVSGRQVATACSDRALFADTTGAHAVRPIREVLNYYKQRAPPTTTLMTCTSVLPAMRFLRYQLDGSCSPPHVDLTKTAAARDYLYHDEDELTEDFATTPESERTPEDIEEHDVAVQRSTHTFIIYLTTCDTGGETALLRSVRYDHIEENDDVRAINTIAAVKPVRGRLLFFPHNHPHEGRAVVIPQGGGHQKLLLRGEMF